MERNHLLRLLSSFPALRTARNEGRDWESTPDEWAPELPEMVPTSLWAARDDHGTFVLARVVRGARTRSGTVSEVRWLIDEDGGILEEESCDLNRADFEEWYAYFGPAAEVNAWR